MNCLLGFWDRNVGVVERGLDDEGVVEGSRGNGREVMVGLENRTTAARVDEGSEHIAKGGKGVAQP